MLALNVTLHVTLDIQYTMSLIHVMLSSTPPPTLIISPKYQNLFTTSEDSLLPTAASAGSPSKWCNLMSTFCTCISGKNPILPSC